MATPLRPAAWVDEHGDLLYRYAMQRVRDRQVAEDLVQETFVSALAAIDRFAAESSERTWLVGILRHKIMDHFRGSARRPDTLGDEANAALEDPTFDKRGHWKRTPARWSADADTLAERGEFWVTFHDCLSKLPRRAADAFCLRELSRLDSKGVCEVLGITATNLWTQLHRARLMLRECLEENWFGRGSAKARK